MEINGREIANKILNELKLKVQKLKEKGITPTLQIILVGNNPGSESYVKQKKLKGEQTGVNVNVLNLDSNITTEELLSKISKFNNDQLVNGIIIQRPLPEQINEEEIDIAVNPSKDVDGFNPNSKFNPPLGSAIIILLESIDKNFRNKKIVIIGKGKTGGEPIVKTFEKENIPYWILDTKTTNKDELTKEAEIIISAVGKPNIIEPQNIKKGVVLISIGLFKGEDNKLHGDYNEKEIKDIASFYTPTPGGVGPVNVASLLKNLVEAAEKNNS